ncbi:MAG: hypothetical protein J6A97_05615 [Clostridia bacterium]|nr:hypothetical protein [Clostridia bacterium]
MKKNKRYDKKLLEIIKSFLLSVFVIMCITALITATEYAGDITGGRLGIRERDTVTTEDLRDFFGEIPIVKDLLLW